MGSERYKGSSASRLREVRCLRLYRFRAIYAYTHYYLSLASNAAPISPASFPSLAFRTRSPANEDEEA